MAASKRQAMHVVAKQALEALGQPVSKDDEDTAGVTPTKPSPATKVLQSVASGKNPVMIVNEVYPDAEFVPMSESGVGMTKSFTMSLNLAGQTFQGSGRNKRLAKAHAAQAALSEIHGVVCFASPGETSLCCSFASVKSFYFLLQC